MQSSHSCAQDEVADALAAVLAVVEASGRLVHVRFADRELGRPGENLYDLTFSAVRPERLLMELDEQLLLIVTRPRVRTASEIRVQVEFDQMTLDWQEYVGRQPHSQTWTSGVLEVWAQGH